MRRLTGFAWVFLVSLIPLAACGEDLVELCVVEVDTWRKDHPPPLDNDNMLDTYTLEEFILNLYVDGENVGWLDSSDFESFSGTLDLQESTITTTVTLEGESETVSGTYTRTVESPHSGVLHIEDTQEGYDVNYSFIEWCSEPTCTTMLTLYAEEPVCEMVAW